MTKPPRTKRPTGRKKKPFYQPEDTAQINYLEDLGDPGRYPFTRGVHSEMYRTRLWTMRQYAGYGTAEESNRRYRYLLSQGTTGLSVAFDLPTQIGLDSDHPQAAGEVGRVGVAIDSLEDMQRLFEGIPLEGISTSMTINATSATILAAYLVAAKRRRVPWTSLRGTIQNDILKEYIARGTYIYPPEPSLRLVTDILSFCQREVPQWNPISVSGYHIREAGATAAQELAFTLANGETYVDAALAAGLRLDDFAPRMSFFFSAHNDLFEEVAKFRAARKIWARLMKEKYGASEERSAMLRFHAQTAGSTLTAQQPDNNVVRVALQALAAVLGGTQSLHTNAKDEALALPTEESATLALRTQQIIAHESRIPETADPLGGSWYLEKLTCDLEEEAEAYRSKIRSLGGVLGAIEEGYIQQEIQQSAYDCQKNLESEKQIVVGVNQFVEGEGGPPEILTIDKKLEAEQVERLRRVREKRSARQFQHAIDRIRKTAGGSENIMPAVLAAIEHYATVGEIAGAMKDVFGEYRETVII